MSHPAYEFETCEAALNGILNGTLTVAGINKDNLSSSGWIWEGPIYLLKKIIPRQDIIAITYKGCLELCGDNTEMHTPKDALNIVATWIFPLAIFFSLPYESLHLKKLHGTLSAVSNWLGSPPTAMTATIFNFDQIRKCHRRSTGSTEWEDSYYVLSCFNQFSLPMQADEDKPNDEKKLNDKFIKTLVYGLFRPRKVDADEGHDMKDDIEYTRQLLAMLASQLRTLRRRSVVPTIFSLGTFLVGFVISIVLAFGEGGDTTSMRLALIYTWLPMLVICTIVDRNPISSEATSELMSRWLHNVNAVREWRAGNVPGAPIGWWTDQIGPEFTVGDFIGQGRRMQYCGLVHAVMEEIETPDRIPGANDLEEYDTLALAAAARLAGRRPGLWFTSATRAIFMVWIPILSGCTVALTSPTVGLGCWSGGFLLYGALTSFSWVVSMFKRTCGPKLRKLCHAVNLIAVIFLVFITGLVLTGGINNCYCNTIWMSYPHRGGYMTFESKAVIREHYEVTAVWATAASIGFGLALAVFLIECFWWVKCQHMWRLQNRERAIPLRSLVKADTSWLQYYDRRRAP